MRKKIPIIFLVIMSLSLFNATCNDGNQKTGTDTADIPHTPDTEAVKVAVKAWAKLDNSLLGQSTPSFNTKPVLSLDGNYLYVPAKGAKWGVAALKIDGAFEKNVFEKAQWSNLALTTQPLSSYPANFKFNQSDGQFVSIYPSRDGLLISWNTLGSGENGVAYFKGSVLEVAWKIEARTTPHFFVIEHNNQEFPYLLYMLSTKTYQKVLRGGLVAQPTILEPGGIKKPYKEKITYPKFAQNDQMAFLVSREGIATLDLNKVGDKFEQHAAPAYSSDAWSMAPGDKNIGVNDAVVVDGFLYIALGAWRGPEDNIGGVAIFDIAKKTTLAPKAAAWNKVWVRSLAVDKNKKVWAVLDKGLIQIKSDGSAGEVLHAQKVKDEQAKLDDTKTAKTGFTGEMPASNISSALFIGESLFLTTFNEAYVMTPQTVEVKSK